ncbi:MAG: hypothetical protein JO336_02625 [Acidobacteriia bacterium]|nr:hypothetical protein [Terriglobia bacterium]MBV8904643.1 hypothetical protein [Terriglobia bacterium]
MYSAVCCAVVAQNEKKDQQVDRAALVDAPAVPQMVVDLDGTLHFGPRTVPLPALASPEARRAYTRRMLQRTQSSAGAANLEPITAAAGRLSPAMKTSFAV